MAGGARIAFTLRVGPFAAEALHVRRVVGTEALSAPFRFEVEFVPAADAPLELAPLPGADAALCLRRPDGAERWVHGVCAAAALVGVEATRPAYRVTIVPRLALLASTADCRVFQGRTAVEVVTAVLDQHGVAHREALAGSTPARELCIQYRETDLAFVSRLLAEEGIAYAFEHSNAGHTMLLVDAPSGFPVRPGAPLPLRRQVGAVALEEHVHALRRRVEVVPGSVTLRDYDFERPGLDVTGEAQAVAEAAADAAGAEHFDHPAAQPRPAEARRLAQARLERLRFDVEAWAGEGTASSLVAGAAFAVQAHPDAAFDGRLLAVRVEHEGRQETAAGAPAALEDAYRNRFLAAPADRPWRPPGMVRGRIRGPQTATVVGPAGEEIHTDRYGRVKVQFHWDRLGKRDDTASAWVRLAQPWAGPGMGAVVVPRIGQEVLVRFLEGDPDCPVVIGAVYNGQHPPPVELPRDRTQSAFRTATSPSDGVNYNLLGFEDHAGNEQVSLKAEEDEVIEVQHDKAQLVHRHEALEVVKDRSRTVHGEQSLRVTVVDDSRVNGDQTLEVAGERATAVGGIFTEHVTGHQSLAVGGSRTLIVDATASESVGAAAALTIGAGYAVNVGGAMNEAVLGAKTVEIGRASIVSVGAERAENVGGTRETRVGGSDAVQVAGALHVQVRRSLEETIGAQAAVTVRGPAAVTSKRHEVEADRLTLVVAGKRILSMERSGQVVISGANVSIDGKAIALGGAAIAKSGPAAPAGAQARLEEARRLEGAPAFVLFTLVDLDGQPIVNQPFALESPAGARREGRTSAEGRVRLPVSKKGSYELTIPRPKGDDPTDEDPKRGKNARKGARRVERGKPVKLPADVDHVLELPERVGMTIAFLFEPGRDKDFPKFVLENEDGAYREERTPKDDLAKGDQYLQLRFTGLLAGTHYTLTRHHDPQHAVTVFEHRPYEEVVDQDRREHKLESVFPGVVEGDQPDRRDDAEGSGDGATGT